eukprot:COSAG01_NODE_614_length_14830_cov_87.820572_9_plen_72_part_00
MCGDFNDGVVCFGGGDSVLRPHHVLQRVVPDHALHPIAGARPWPIIIMQHHDDDRSRFDWDCLSRAALACV